VSFLLDTCVISELRKPIPDEGVLAWLELCEEEMLYLSTVTLGELRYGIDLLPESKQKMELLTWYAQVCCSYADHILDVTCTAFERWGTLRASCQKSGIKLGMGDGLIAAVAIVNGMTVVTRNTADFINTGVGLINPWS
jgi:toxin FitB